MRDVNTEPLRGSPGAVIVAETRHGFDLLDRLWNGSGAQERCLMQETVTK
jgi:hypothetical protein